MNLFVFNFYLFCHGFIIAWIMKCIWCIAAVYYNMSLFSLEAVQCALASYSLLTWFFHLQCVFSLDLVFVSLIHCSLTWFYVLWFRTCSFAWLNSLATNRVLGLESLAFDFKHSYLAWFCNLSVLQFSVYRFLLCLFPCFYFTRAVIKRIINVYAFGKICRMSSFFVTIHPFIHISVPLHNAALLVLLCCTSWCWCIIFFCIYHIH